MTALYPIDPQLDFLELHRLKPNRYPFLLETVAQPLNGEGFDILFAYPGQSIKADAVAGSAKPFLQQLDAQWQQQKPDAIDDECAQLKSLPFRGGWFVFLSYDLAAQIEPSLKLPIADNDFPLAFAVRIPVALIRDHRQQQSYLLLEDDDPDVLAQVMDDICQCLQHDPGANKHSSAADGSGFYKDMREADPNEYQRQVEIIKQYIREGDVFQVNLSRQWSTALTESFSENQGDVDLYRCLRKTNPAPFAGLVSYEGWTILSSSPERLVQVAPLCEGPPWIETRPIAGTRPRGADSRADARLQEELMAHPKERAEHIMLIDLERNDLGRVCQPGSIEVNELMTMETYQHVHHIVSNVRGKLRPQVSPGQIIQAVFPGGTITGCPKVRCMEIIYELEAGRRGAYTGSMGYLNRDGSMDLNILIRTLVAGNNTLSLRAGAGIVADSLPKKEVLETQAKAKGMLKAITMAASLTQVMQNETDHDSC